MKKFLLLVFLLCASILLAQVGIGTTKPLESLHIEGDLIVEGFNDLDNSTSLVGADDMGNLTLLNLDNQLTLENNTLQLAGSIYYGIGDMNLGSITILPGNYTHDLDLQLGPGELNEGKVVIRVYNLPSNIKLTGIQDGLDGMHLFFYHSGTQNIVFTDEADPKALGSIPKNRIKVLASSETISAEGSIEMIYDGVLQRWLFLSIHD